MLRIIPFGILLKLWASGQSDAFLLVLLGFTAEVDKILHVIPLLLRQTELVRIYAETFHPGVVKHPSAFTFSRPPCSPIRKVLTL